MENTNFAKENNGYSDNMVSKEQIFNEITTNLLDQIGEKHSKEVINVLSGIFENIDFIQNKQYLSSHVIDNEKFINIFMAVKSINGCKQSTIKSYVYTVRDFDAFCNVDFRNIETNHVRVYLLKKEQSNSKSTLNNIRRNLNSFFEFMVDEGYIDRNPVKKIPNMKEPVKKKHWLTEIEIENIRDSCVTKRELALVDLLISTGLRVSEVTNLKINDIDWEKRELTATETKNGKDRTIPISVRCSKHLREYIGTHKYHTGYVFEPIVWARSEKVSTATIEKELHTIGERCDLPKLTVHFFRRYYASSMQKKGVSPDVIQELMGHSSYNTTNRYYLSKNTDRLHMAVDRFIA